MNRYLENTVTGVVMAAVGIAAWGLVLLLRRYFWSVVAGTVTIMIFAALLFVLVRFIHWAWTF